MSGRAFVLARGHLFAEAPVKGAFVRTPTYIMSVSTSFAACFEVTSSNVGLHSNDAREIDLFILITDTQPPLNHVIRTGVSKSFTI